MTDQLIDAIINASEEKTVQRVAQKTMQMVDEQRAVLSDFYNHRISFAEELRRLDEIDAKYAN